MEDFHRYISVAGYSTAALFGVVLGNYLSGIVDPSASNPLVDLGAGLVVLGIPAFLMHKNDGIEGSFRLMIGVSGATMAWRGLLAPGILNLQQNLPTQVGSVI